MTYRDALRWLYSTQRFGIKLGLQNAERLLAALDLPARGHRIVHVAGTNGKGSVCAMAAAICRAQGFRTGLFTSPHLITFRERIQVDGEMIGQEDVAAGLTSIRRVTAGWNSHPTFFEITAALSLMHFARAACDVVVLETGLGGRLDATNAVGSDVAVLTPIAMDHQEFLGHSLGEIASEKAGIIKLGIPVVSAPQVEEARAVIQGHALARDAPLHFVHQPYTGSRLNLAGDHQRWNAALAIEALAKASILVEDKAVVLGLAEVSWPARFQRWNLHLVIDGAHNEASALVLARTWKELFGAQRAQLVLGVLRDKDAAAIWRALQPIAGDVHLPCFISERARTPHELRSIITSISPTTSLVEHPNIGSSIEAVVRQKQRALITGSLHFAGEALAHLSGVDSALEDCAQ